MTFQKRNPFYYQNRNYPIVDIDIGVGDSWLWDGGMHAKYCLKMKQRLDFDWLFC